MTKPYEKETYYALTIDPVHVGTGGYRLGRVDNTITREPGTNLPKIPGTSISGVVRAYTAMAIQSENQTEISADFKIDYNKYRQWKYRRPLFKISNIEDGKALIIVDHPSKKPLYENDEPKYYSCAGKGADDGESHCGEHDCPVCIAFGFSKGKSGSSFQGLAQFSDARILFFPVYSMIGPVWITCPSVLEDFKEALKTKTELTLNLTISESDEKIQTALVKGGEKLNLGWILLENINQACPLTGPIPKLSTEILNRLVLVSNNRFSNIVNDNLEVRTSVAIDPATGAAEEGALYSYEAIPRATVMWFDVVYNNPEYFTIKQREKVIENGKEKEMLVAKEVTKSNGAKADWTWIKENVEKGLSLMEYLGVGGMGTRGMGRLRILNIGG